MAISWVDLREKSPVDISRLVSHANSFNSFVGVKITLNNLNRSKKSLIDARGELDLVFTMLQQVLYSREVLKGRIDEILYGWLTDNIGRYLKDLDEKEEDLLVKYDEVNSDIKRVGISRLASYSKALKFANNIIYESLLKSINEYEKISEDEEQKKDKRTFLYILFHVLQVTMASVGGLARKGNGTAIKKGQVGSYPTTWQSMMSNKGQEQIARINEENTGEKIEVPDFMVEKENQDVKESDTNENTILYEEYEEEEDGSD